MTGRELSLEIVRSVAERHDLGLRDILGKSRERRIVRARHEAFYEVKLRRGLSYPQVGLVFGGMDHSSIIHGVAMHKQRLEKAMMPVVAVTNCKAGTTAGLV